MIQKNQSNQNKILYISVFHATCRNGGADEVLIFINWLYENKTLNKTSLLVFSDI